MNVREIRKKTAMTRREFCDLFGFRLIDLVGWEDREFQPTGVERVLLILIDKKTRLVIKALGEGVL